MQIVLDALTVTALYTFYKPSMAVPPQAKDLANMLVDFGNRLTNAYIEVSPDDASLLDTVSAETISELWPANVLFKQALSGVLQALGLANALSKKIRVEQKFYVGNKEVSSRAEAYAYVRVKAVVEELRLDVSFDEDCATAVLVEVFKKYDLVRRST